MFRSLRHNFDYQLLGFALLFLGMFVPVPWVKTSIFSIFSLLMILREGYVTGLRKTLGSFRVWAFLGFFLLHVIGMFYSDDMDRALQVLILRIPLLLFPLLLFPVVLSHSERRSVILLFAWVTILMGYLGFIKQLFYMARVDADTGWLYNDNLVSLFRLQAVYYGMYLAVAFLILLDELLTRKRETGKALIIFGLISCVVLNFLVASRMSMATLYAGGFLLVLLRSRGRALWRRSLVSVVLGTAAIVILVALFPRTVNRYKILFTGKAHYEFSDPVAYSHFNDEPSDQKWNGLNTRLALWNRATEAIKERPFMGSGTGDLLDDLIQKYKEVNFLLGIEREFRTHNQFLEVTVMFGFAGLAIFLLMLFVIFRQGVMARDVLGTLIMTVLVFGMLTEDVLSKNQGVIFYGFFMALVASGSKTAFR